MSAPSLAATWALELGEYPTALAWAPGAGLLALGRGDGRVAVIDGAAGTAAGALDAHADAVTALAWHPDELILASAGQDGAVRLLRPERAPQVLVEPGATWIEHLAWHPRGKRVAVARGREALVLDPGGHRAPIVLGPVESTVAGLAWARDGRSLAVACYGGVRVFDPVTGARIRQLDHRGAMLGVVWSPGGKVLAGGCQDQTVHFWRLPGGQDAEMTGYPGKPRDVVWSPDGRWLATGGGPTLTLWNFAARGPEGTRPRELDGHDAPVTGLAYAPAGGFLLSGDRDGRLCHWLPDDTHAPVAVHELTAKVTALGWGAAVRAGQLRWAAASADGLVTGGAL